MIDAIQRFLLEDLDIRGAVVRLSEVWQALLQGRDYTGGVASLFGQASAVTAIIAAKLKNTGRLTLQLQGHGPVRLLVVDCTANLNLRGHVRSEGDLTALDVPSLFGDGQLLMTLDFADGTQPYQSYVPIEGATLAEVFEHYLAQSEQAPARLWLAADGQGAAGLFLQKLPGADERDPDGWNRIVQLAETVREAELLGLPAEQLLTRLFHEETVRIFPPRAVRHDWPMDWDKIRATLRSLGRTEIDAIVRDQGEIVVHDDLSNHTYRFGPGDIDALFSDPTSRLH
ncbi:MAG: Hsp33 family molecular chaperone HslO [Zoogloeaceae bacterium]|nr:Hsp33 family molecular chaperone HslO [Zoogloeaceae bacterium]